VLPKVSHQPTSSGDIATIDQFEERNCSGSTLSDLRKSLQFMRSRNNGETNYGGFVRASQGSLDGHTQNSFMPSQSPFNLKRNKSMPKQLKTKLTPYNRSTPFVKSRMENLLKNYEHGLTTEKYLKNNQSNSKNDKSSGRLKL
jgi:hypothetical protein